MTDTQTPIAIIGVSCRLPGDSNTPGQFWQNLLDGKVADTNPPSSRFNLTGHYDKTLRPWTMRSPGGMFINIDPQDLDAGFFGLSQADAISMDPQHRQLLEVVYEGLENAGLALEAIKSKLYGCFVGSYASDYSDIQSRDPEDKSPSFTVGNGRAMMSNRISHFLDIKGPSMTIDTACSGSLISVDLACRYLDSHDADGAIVAGCNLYMSPEHNMDYTAMTSAFSPSGKCWTFDARADGYIKAEAVNCLILKRLDDAVRDGDPIRAVIRGTSTNSDGWTPGIASPSAQAQAAAIRRAYSRAGIQNFQDTTYLECHGTGTLAGDPIECSAASLVFSSSRLDNSPLRIGSVKSNIGHSEPAAGISGMIKAILSVESGIIPGNPTFEIPNPKIDFEGCRILPSKINCPWPRGALRRASVNSFGYGGSNAHAIVESPAILLPGYHAASVSSYNRDPDDLFSFQKEDKTRRLLLFSANDEPSLRGNVREHIRHLSNPIVSINSADLAYTLSIKRSRHFFRAYVVSSGMSFKESDVTYGKLRPMKSIGLVFTGQGAQWPQMGNDLIERFPVARATIRHLDTVLKSMSCAPIWSLEKELSDPRSEEHMRLPEFSQPLVTALQLAVLAVLKDLKMKPAMAIGHSSGEIAAAVATGHLLPEWGIKVAYLRGKAVKDFQASQAVKLGMMAVGLGSSDATKYLEQFPKVRIACMNSPKSVTLSGPLDDLQSAKSIITNDGVFARILKVDMAYHSSYMSDIAHYYEELLTAHCPNLVEKKMNPSGQFFSTVHGRIDEDIMDAKYWVKNMVSPVLFYQGISAMIQGGGADFLVEIGPSSGLAGPIKQTLESLGQSSAVTYTASLSRNQDSTKSLFELAGKLFFSGFDVDMLRVNGINPSIERPKTIVDLPNYQWNHSVKYWHESLASRDWRYRQFPIHDLLGSKCLGTSWNMPSFKRTLRLKDVNWITDHRLGTEVVFPASGYIAMAVEAMMQTTKTLGTSHFSNITDFSQATFRLRNIQLSRALVLEEDMAHYIYLFLNPLHGHKDTWFEFKISSMKEHLWIEHCSGLVRIEPTAGTAHNHVSVPLRQTTSAKPWYKSMGKVGFNFGPSFQNLTEIEAVPGRRECRARVKLPEPSALEGQSLYTIHPTTFDAFFQAGIPALYQGHRTLIEKALVPKSFDEVILFPKMPSTSPSSAIATCRSYYPKDSTIRPEKVETYKSDATVCDENSGFVLAKIKGLQYTVLDISEIQTGSFISMSISWKLDISLLHSDINLMAFAQSDMEATSLASDLNLPLTAAYLLVLARHKICMPSILDLDMTLDNSDLHTQLQSPKVLSSYCSKCQQYATACKTMAKLNEAQRRFQSIAGTEVHMYDATATTQNIFNEKKRFDFVILRIPHGSEETVAAAIATARRNCIPGGYISIVLQKVNHSVESNIGAEGKLMSLSTMKSFLSSQGLSIRSQTPADLVSSESTSIVYLCGTEKPLKMKRSFTKYAIVDLSSGTSGLCSAVIEILDKNKWAGTSVPLSYAVHQPLGVPLILIDSPASPLLANIDKKEWEHLRGILVAGRKILWVTSGSQMISSSPSNSLVYGFARSVRGEEPALKVKVLDLSSYENSSASQSIFDIICTFFQPGDSLKTIDQIKDDEYCEESGAIHVSRVIPDQALVKASQERRSGDIELTEMWLKKSPRVIRLCCEKLGAMDSIHFHEIRSPNNLDGNEVEIDIKASGMNYKDIATSLGLVPENEHKLGLEGAGLVKRTGKRVTNYHVGDRVMFFAKGAYANKISTPQENVVAIPDQVSFEEAATMPVVYFTAIYCLMDIAQVTKGQSILIHSAAGGVGIATLQLSRYLGLEVYVTAGTSDKRKFLETEFGIPPERIYSSRSNEFAASVRELTNGRGVDYVLNFLTGDLLDESWRLLADKGTLLEIGKKDILNRNYLSMEPFNRNCSFRAVDISRPAILYDLPLVKKVLHTVGSLLSAGFIQPISPRKVFGYDKIIDAMRYMRSGDHIGKIVISNGHVDDIVVSVRPSPRALTFDTDATYLIVGGLKGLCGSLALYLARCGVKNLTVLSRSGAGDDHSRQVLNYLQHLGTNTIIAKADILNLNDVVQVFQNSPLPIKGIVQGAMVLKDKTFESMALEEYYEGLNCKFHGTWNLHKAARELSGGPKLDFFTMLSSISGIIGTASQSNYAAGNSFQDAFSKYRHLQGLKAHTIDLGLIEDVGYLSKNENVAERLQGRSGLSGIDEAQLQEIFHMSLLQQYHAISPESVTQMITGLPFPIPEDSPVLADKRFHSILVPTSVRDKDTTVYNNEQVQAQGFQALLKTSMSPDKLVSEAAILVNAKMVRLLGLASDVEESKSLSSYGIDSLAAVDLRNWINRYMGTDLTTLDVLNAANLRTLCEKIVSRSRRC